MQNPYGRKAPGALESRLSIWKEVDSLITRTSGKLIQPLFLERTLRLMPITVLRF